jgi:hypothetical protein
MHHINPKEAGTIANSLENSNKSHCHGSVANGVDRESEKEFDNLEDRETRAVGKCRDLSEIIVEMGPITIEKTLTGSSVSVSVSPAHITPGVVQITFPSVSQSLSVSPSPPSTCLEDIAAKIRCRKLVLLPCNGT